MHIVNVVPHIRVGSVHSYKEYKTETGRNILHDWHGKATEVLYQGYWRQAWGDIAAGLQNQIRMQFEVYKEYL